MSKKNKQTGNKMNRFLRDEILDFFKKNKEKSFNYKQLAAALNVDDVELRKLIFSLLNSLTSEGYLKEIQRGQFKLVPSEVDQELIGVIEITQRGAGYVSVNDLKGDVYISSKYCDRVINGDKVAIQLFTNSKSRKPEGKILRVLDRSDRLFVGTLEVQQHIAFLVPDDPKITVDIFIPTAKLRSGKDGYKAIAKITDWPDEAKNPFGEIMELLG